MTTNDQTPTAFIGCDVGKASIVVFDSRDGRTRGIRNCPQALSLFASALDQTCLVICEATGGYEAALLDAMAHAGRSAHRADARKVKAFIRSLGTLGKSDAIDARALARYGQERHAVLVRWQPADAERDGLHALVMTRGDLVAAHTAWSNRRGAPTVGTAKRFLDRVIACLERQIRAIEVRITALLAACQPLQQLVQRLSQIPGIGTTTATALVALMPELGTLNRRQVAALAGLAPHPNDSGSSHGYRYTRGGREEVKRLLFMAALSAARHHPDLRRFHQRLLAKGKKPIVATVAVMRKLIIICNASLRAPANSGPRAAANPPPRRSSVRPRTCSSVPTSPRKAATRSAGHGWPQATAAGGATRP